MSSSKSSNSYLELYQELYGLTGSKIQFKTTLGEFQGIIKLVLPKGKRVEFNHVYFEPTHEYVGTSVFFFREFISYSVIKSQKYEKFEYLSRILNKENIGNKYHITDVLNEGLEEKCVLNETIPDPNELFKDDHVMNLPDNLQKKLPHDSLVLDSITGEFYQAIGYISQQKVIGVSFEGPKISRLGKLTWICVSTPYCVFLFDIEQLGKDAFDKGLRNIFQDKNIEKVIHDCRQPSDCLSHLFGTELVNVFDTQVADYIVNMQRYREYKPALKHVSSLDSCLVHHLDVPQEFLFNRKNHLSYENEVIFFRVRPISHDYRDAVIKNVAYLVLLKETLKELMLNPFRKAVDIYLKVLANASEPELLLDISVPEMIPPALIMEGIQTVRFQEISPEVTVVPLVCKFKYSEPVTDYLNRPSNIAVKNMSSEKKVAAVPLTCRFRGSKKDAADDYCRPSNILANNASLEKDIDNKSAVVAEENLHNISKKDKQVLHQNIVSKKNLCNKSVTVEQMSIQNSKLHMDNVYHRLANSLGNFSSNAIDVKPSQDYVSNFTVKKLSIRSGVSIKSTSESNSDSSTSDLNDSWETVSERSGEKGTDILTDSSDIWAKLRSAYSVLSYDPENEKSLGSKKKLCFLPAGM